MLDNVLMGGRGARPRADDEAAEVMRELNDRLAADDRVEVAMLGVADGITLALSGERRTRPDDEAVVRAGRAAGSRPAGSCWPRAPAAAVWERDGVLAAIVPAAPGPLGLQLGLLRATASALLASLEEIAAAYDEAGIRPGRSGCPEGRRGRARRWRRPATSSTPSRGPWAWSSPSCGRRSPTRGVEMRED